MDILLALLIWLGVLTGPAADARPIPGEQGSTVTLGESGTNFGESGTNLHPRGGDQ